MFVDASAIVAILTREGDADELLDVLDTARSPVTSAIAVFEATLGICRKRHASVAEARRDVSDFWKPPAFVPCRSPAGRRTPPWTPSPATARVEVIPPG